MYLNEQCPICGSKSIYDHSNPTLSPQHGIAESSHRCRKCKSYFRKRYNIGPAQIKYHAYLIHRYDPISGTFRLTVNPKKDDVPDLTPPEEQL